MTEPDLQEVVEDGPTAGQALEVFDETGIRGWLRSNIELLMRAFGLPHWRISLDFVPLSGSDGSGETAVLMECASQPEYERAVIRVDVSNCYRLLDDYEQLQSHLEHELLHVALSPLKLARYTANNLLDTMRDQDVLLSSWLNHEELVVRNLERLVFQLRAASGRTTEKARTN